MFIRGEIDGKAKPSKNDFEIITIFHGRRLLRI